MIGWMSRVAAYKDFMHEDPATRLRQYTGEHERDSVESPSLLVFAVIATIQMVVGIGIGVGVGWLIWG